MFSLWADTSARPYGVSATNYVGAGHPAGPPKPPLTGEVAARRADGEVVFAERSRPFPTSTALKGFSQGKPTHPGKDKAYARF